MFSAATTPPRLITLILLSGISVLSLNLFSPSLVNIATDFEADYILVSLSITGYLAVGAVLQIFIGPLSDRFGRRPVLLSAMIVFFLASIGCYFAQNIWVFLFFRMLQGAVIAASALPSAVVRDMLPVKQAASLLGYIAMVMAIAPMLGPMIGGVLDELFGWRSSFMVFVMLGFMLVVLIWVDLGETNKTPSETFKSQFRAYPALLSSRLFWGYALCSALSTGAFYAFLAGAPLISRTLFSMSTSELGVYIGSITGGFFLGSFIAGRFSGKYSLSTMMLAGRIVACFGLLCGIGLFLAGVVHEFSFFGATIFVGIGNGITMPSSRVGVMSIRPELAGSASGLAGALTVGGGAVLTSLTSFVTTEETGGLALLGMMFAASFLSLIAAVWVAQIDPESDDR